MSATLVSNNTTIKINAAVSAHRSTNGTMYTAPATGFAVIQISFDTGTTGAAQISIGGQAVISCSANGVAGVSPHSSVQAQGGAYVGSTAGQGGGLFVVGPSQSVVVGGLGGTMNVQISGVEFINTP